MNPHEISHFCWSNPPLSSQRDAARQVPVEDGPTDEELAKAAAMKKDGPTVRRSDCPGKTGDVSAEEMVEVSENRPPSLLVVTMGFTTHSHPWRLDVLGVPLFFRKTLFVSWFTEAWVTLESHSDELETFGGFETTKKSENRENLHGYGPIL